MLDHLYSNSLIEQYRKKPAQTEEKNLHIGYIVGSVSLLADKSRK